MMFYSKCVVVSLLCIPLNLILALEVIGLSPIVFEVRKTSLKFARNAQVSIPMVLVSIPSLLFFKNCEEVSIPLALVSIPN